MTSAQEIALFWIKKQLNVNRPVELQLTATIASSQEVGVMVVLIRQIVLKAFSSLVPKGYTLTNCMFVTQTITESLSLTRSSNASHMAVIGGKASGRSWTA